MALAGGVTAACVLAALVGLALAPSDAPDALSEAPERTRAANLGPSSPAHPASPGQAPAQRPPDAGLAALGPGVADPGDASVGDAGLDADLRFPDPGGRHWRLDTPNGPVHVWIPDDYQPDTAGVALYVHGYYVRVDEAWRVHHLAAQFAASGRNALFIAPEAPARGRHQVSWSNLGHLLREVRQHTGLAPTWGPVVALGHSGAYRTLLDWLDDDLIGHVIVIDGLYGHEQPFLDWLEGPATPPRRLTLVGLDTLSWSELATARHPLVTELDWVPETIADIPAEARQARLLNIRSQFDHMDLIVAGQALPVLLALSGLPGF